MGDRGFVKINGIGIYTHWGATELEQTVARALNKKWRWDDENYLARIIFDEMNYDPKSECGLGIGPDSDDYGARKIISIKDKKISVIEPRTKVVDGDFYSRNETMFNGSFEDFISKYNVESK